MNKPQMNAQPRLTIAVWRRLPYLAALGLCSCTTISSQQAMDRTVAGHAGHPAVHSSDTGASTEHSTHSTLPETNSLVNKPSEVSAAVIQPIQQVSAEFTHASDDSIGYCPVPGALPSGPGGNGSYQIPIEFTPAEPRIEVVESLQRPADEYLFDGGDRQLPLHYNGSARVGLETEDTIVEFRDHHGEAHVKASNRVGIYAPRFGAVRTVNGLHQGTSVDRLASASERQRGSGLSGQVSPGRHAVNLRATDVRMRSRASGLENNEAQLAFRQRETAGQQIQNQSAILNLAFVKRGEFDQSSEAVLAYGIDAAATWTRDLYPLIKGSIQTGQEVYATFQPAEMVGIDEDHKTDGDLRIVKLADRKHAKPGDIVTFTIRFDNIGDRELQSIRIVDNLTPRLEFIPGSERWEPALGKMLAPRENGEGSVILEFVLDEPLAGHSGGILTFQTRVR